MPAKAGIHVGGVMRGGWVYIMTNQPFGTLYIGVTSDIGRRVLRHRAGEGSAFCKQHGLNRLVYVERFERIEDAIAREKAMKSWKRNWSLGASSKRIPIGMIYSRQSSDDMGPSLRWGDVF